MIQEGPVAQICVAVVIGTPEEAAAFVRQFAPSASVSVVETPTTLRAVDVPPTRTRAADDPLDEIDLAIIQLSEVAALTPSESLVLALRGRGYSNGQIGRVLDITESTVKCHVNHALRKVGERDGARPARVIARAVAEVRGRPIAMTRDHDAWLRPLGIALVRLEPKSDVTAARVRVR